jgi:hypothetical protein
MIFIAGSSGQTQQTDADTALRCDYLVASDYFFSFHPRFYTLPTAKPSHWTCFPSCTMANGIADIAYWTTVPEFRGTRRQQYYSVYQEGFFGNPQMPSVWETQNLSSESEWSCDHEGSCCTCDCDCQPIKNINQALGGHVNLPQNKPELVSEALSGLYTCAGLTVVLHRLTAPTCRGIRQATSHKDTQILEGNSKFNPTICQG